MNGNKSAGTVALIIQSSRMERFGNSWTRKSVLKYYFPNRSFFFNIAQDMQYHELTVFTTAGENAFCELLQGKSSSIVFRFSVSSLFQSSSHFYILN